MSNQRLLCRSREEVALRITDIHNSAETDGEQLTRTLLLLEYDAFDGRTQHKMWAKAKNHLIQLLLKDDFNDDDARVLEELLWFNKWEQNITVNFPGP